MTLWQALALGVVQGVTEFLPVSSSAHLVILQHFFHLEGPILLVFDVVVHVGTLFSVIIFFLKSILKMIQSERRLLWLIALATLPTAGLGLFVREWSGLLFTTLQPVAIALLLNSFILWSTRQISEMETKTECSSFDALMIGVIQGISVIPGISRAGSTISGGLWLRLKREDAFRFSFLISIPAILGAMVVVLPESLTLLHADSGAVLLVGFGSAFVSGYFSISILYKIVRSGKLHLFAIYTLLLSFVAFYYSSLQTT
jgi:undecaprenyl-diphosphatase